MAHDEALATGRRAAVEPFDQLAVGTADADRQGSHEERPLPFGGLANFLEA